MNRRGEAGHVLPLIAVCLAVLMGFGGMGVDVGYWEYNQREQQNAADAAAIGGAQQLIYDGCGDQTDATTAAKADSADGGFTDGSNGVSVNVQNPPTSGPFSGNNCAVQAQVVSTQLPTFLTHVLGFNNMGETTQATAEVVYNNGGCIYMLDPTQNTNFNGSNVSAPKCSILINGSANFTTSATIDAASIGEANYTGSHNVATFTGGSPTSMLPVADPCPEIAACAALTNTPPSTSPCNGTYTGNGILVGGCYNNLNLNGQTVTLQSGGVFAFTGSLNVNMANITGNGVTMYIAANTTTNFNKVGSFTLSPPTSGTYKGVSYYQVKGNTNTVNFNMSNTNVSGMIYAPSAQINYNASYGLYTVIVAAYANFNGSTGQDFGNPTAGSTLIPDVVLAQ